MGLFSNTGVFFISYTKNPEEAASLGYVNPGTDRRIAGDLGKLLGSLQSQLSFKTTERPEKKVDVHNDGKLIVETQTFEGGKQHVAIALYRGSGRWATLRYGYRIDENWGDERTVGHNPDPEIVGGAIFDVVIKLNATQTFIAGYEHGI